MSATEFTVRGACYSARLSGRWPLLTAHQTSAMATAISRTAHAEAYQLISGSTTKWDPALSSSNSPIPMTMGMTRATMPKAATVRRCAPAVSAATAAKATIESWPARASPKTVRRNPATGPSWHSMFFRRVLAVSWLFGCHPLTGGDGSGWEARMSASLSAEQPHRPACRSSSGRLNP